jgi:chromosome partitioning protein
MKTVALYNLKGGVGKTASAVNLAHLAALDGRRVLLVDLDPQGAATFYLRHDVGRKGGRKVLTEGVDDLRDQVRATDFERLDLLPADLSLRKLDLALDARKDRHQLKRRLASFVPHYDLILIDCPPSLSALSEQVFEAADALLVPTVPTPLSLRTLDQLFEFLKERGPKGLHVWPFFSMVDRRKRLHREALERSGFLAAAIPNSSEIEQMGTFRAPIAAFASSSLAARASLQLWVALRERLAKL